MSVTLTLSPEEARQIKAILAIVRRKAERGPFWAHFKDTAVRVLQVLP